MFKNKVSFIVAMIVISSIMLASCAPAPATTTQPESVVVTQVVTQEVIKEVEVIREVPASGEATEEEKFGGTFIFGAQATELPGVSPIHNNGGDEIRVYQMATEPLTWGGENFPPEVRPILAKSWEVSEDGLTWTVHLQEGVKWQDGKPFTADDVIFWASVLEDPETVGVSQFAQRFFVNDKPYVFEKVDDYTVTITSDVPVPSLLANIGVPIIPKHYFEEHGIANKDMKASPFNNELALGTGPFTMVENRVGEAVILERNEEYWRGRPYLDSFVFRLIPDAQTRIAALKTGEIDFARIQPKQVPELLSSPNIKILNLLVDYQDHLRLNVTKPNLADKRTRQALMFALDRLAILQVMEFGYGQVADSPFNPIVSAYEPTTTYTYDVEKANALLAEVGWEKGADGFLVAKNVEGVAPGSKLTLVLDAMDADETKAFAMVQSYWQAVGVDAQIRQIDSSVWREENNSKEDKPYDVMFSGKGFVGDNGVNWDNVMASTRKDSTSSYENPVTIDLFNKARAATDVAERDEYLKQAAAIIWEDLPYLPLWYQSRVWAYNTRVHLEDADFQVGLVGYFGRPDKIWVEK